MSDDEYTTIRIKKTNEARLRKLGISGENADEILEKLLDNYVL